MRRTHRHRRRSQGPLRYGFHRPHRPQGASVSDFQRLLVVRLGSMGDIIHTLPAVAMLRSAFPEATIGWAVERRWASLLSTAEALTGSRSAQRPLADTVHIVDTFAWRTAVFSDETWRE